MNLIHSVFFVLALLAFILTLISGINGKVPLWIPLLLVTIALMIQSIPAT